jgi:DNA-binding MarR family transcriptional regulator
MSTGEEERELNAAPTLDETVEEIARECVAVRLRLLNRVITSVYDDALRPLGVKVSQMNILVAAARLGIAQPSQVCRILQMDLSTLSRNLERLRARGWIETVPDRDTRVHPFRVTEPGRELIRQAYPAWQEAQQKAIALLGPEGAALLAQVARNMVSKNDEA